MMPTHAMMQLMQPVQLIQLMLSCRVETIGEVMRYLPLPSFTDGTVEDVAGSVWVSTRTLATLVPAHDGRGMCVKLDMDMHTDTYLCVCVCVHRHTDVYVRVVCRLSCTCACKCKCICVCVYVCVNMCVCGCDDRT